MKRMLFNATQSEELRVAIIDESKLENLDFERGNKEQRKSNIYKAVVTRVEPSLEAAFVNYGVDRHGFLPFKEIAQEYYSKKTRKKVISIKDVIKEGQELIIQVTKEERGNKGAALTTYLSLAGRYIVLMPNNNDGGGISRRIEGDERSTFKDILTQIKVKKGMSVIGRTAGIGAALEEVQWDLDYLNQLWDAIASAANAQPAPFLIYQESNLVIRAIRDYFSTDIEEILIDKQEIYEQAHQFMSHVMPNYVDRIKLYAEETSLFSKFKIENQIESAFLREVQLPAGGSIVIDHTEALVSVDVNSSRSTKGRDIENTALNTNLEAATEITKQLRLRDIGGLIVIDFIDMENPKNQRDVENKMRDELKQDKARIQTNTISRFGLLELSRQRLRPSLGESVNGICPRCEGTGRVRDIQSTALFILRLIEEAASKKNNQSISIQIPVEVATLLLNEKRKDIQDIEDRNDNEIIIIPNRYFEIPKFHIETSSKKIGAASYSVVEQPLEESLSESEKNDTQKEKLEPVVKSLIPSQKNIKTKNNKSIFGFFKSLISTNDGQAPKIDENIPSEQKVKNVNGTDFKNRNNKRRNNRGRRSPYVKNTHNKEQAHLSSNVPKKSIDKPSHAPDLDNHKKVGGKIKETSSNEKIKKIPQKKITPKLEKVDLSKVGLKLVETKALPKVDEKKIQKKVTRKTAGWQKQKDTSEKKETKLVMIETKKITKNKSTKGNIKKKVNQLKV